MSRPIRFPRFKYEEHLPFYHCLQTRFIGISYQKKIRFRFRFSDFRRRGAFPRWNPNEDALTYAHNEINLIRQRL